VAIIRFPSSLSADKLFKGALPSDRVGRRERNPDRVRGHVPVCQQPAQRERPQRIHALGRAGDQQTGGQEQPGGDSSGADVRPPRVRAQTRGVQTLQGDGGLPAGGLSQPPGRYDPHQRFAHAGIHTQTRVIIN
jgi:hypothetical protein